MQCGQEVPRSPPAMVDGWGDVVLGSGMPVTKMGGMSHTGKEPQTVLSPTGGWVTFSS